MRIALAVVVLAAALAVFVYLDFGRAATSLPSPAPSAAVASPAAGDSRLAMQIAALQREVEALKSRVGNQTQPGAHPSGVDAHGSAPAPMDAKAVDAERAAEAERHRVYMAGVAQAFAAEKIDFSWAGYASSRLAATLEDDEVLRTAAHTLECRQQTCRLQIEDDGSGKVSQRLTMMSMHLMDVLPTAAAELVDQGNGRSALVLYMSSQPSARPPGPPK